MRGGSSILAGGSRLVTQPGLFRPFFFERFARSVPHFLKGAAPVLPRPTRRFERDARLTPQILKGMEHTGMS
jgi:hypothetical protein